MDSAPTDLTATAVSTSAVYLAWTNPSGPLTDNQVNIFTGGSCSTPLGAIDLGTVATQFEWGDLSSGTNYSFNVQAANESGLGPVSNCANATTNPTPPGAPTNLILETASPSAILLTWTDPSGPLTDIQVNIFTGDSCSAPLGSIDLGVVTTAFEWGDLSPGTIYSVTVQAANDSGFGPDSNCAFTQTDTNPPASPTDLEVAPVSSSAILMSWTNPAGPLTDDEVNIYTDSSCSTPLGAIDLGGVTTVFEWGGLSAATAYSFTVQAANASGLGSDSNCASAITDPEAPSAPTELTATPASSSAISLSWTPPSSDGGAAISSYDLSIYTGSTCSTPLGAINTGGGVTTAFEWGDLSSGSDYSFTVQAANDVGVSPVSNCASATTQTTPPSAPIDLTVSAASFQAILMNWTNPPGPLDYDQVNIYTGNSCSAPLGAINLGGVATAFEWGGLFPSTTYSFTVQAANDTGLSPVSNCANATTPHDPIIPAPAAVGVSTGPVPQPETACRVF